MHRLASDVLAHALLPDSASQTDPIEAQRTTNAALMQVDAAMKVIIEFFTACTYGYMRHCGAERRTANAGDSGVE